MAVFAYVAGLAIAPTLIPAFGLVERLVPPRMLTEGFTWISTALALGVGGGVVLAGQLVDSGGPSRAFIVCPAAAAAALVLGSAGRRYLSNAPQPAEDRVGHS
jgi:predicted MFS family arabinose efflux permease